MLKSRVYVCACPATNRKSPTCMLWVFRVLGLWRFVPIGAPYYYNRCRQMNRPTSVVVGNCISNHHRKDWLRSMPSSTIVVGRLSHCLRLSRSPIQLRCRRLHIISRHKLRPPRQVPNVTQQPVQRYRNTATVASRKTRRGTHTIGQQLKVQFRSAELRDQEQVRRLEIGIAYQNLRQIALGANHRQTQECVRILIEERGERPNLRLYEALLLANGDHEHGSAFEVARILEEIKNEGLTPDSATHHAILRVHHEEKILYTCTQLILGRSSPYIPIISSDTTYSSNYANDGFPLPKMAGIM